MCGGSHGSSIVLEDRCLQNVIRIVMVWRQHLSGMNIQKSDKHYISNCGSTDGDNYKVKLYSIVIFGALWLFVNQRRIEIVLLTYLLIALHRASDVLSDRFLQKCHQSDNLTDNHDSLKTAYLKCKHREVLWTDVIETTPVTTFGRSQHIDSSTSATAITLVITE